MPATLAQRARLLDIADEIARCDNHPSPNVQKVAACFPRELKDKTIKRIRKVREEDDGFMAHHLIKNWHNSGIHGVILGENPTHKCTCGYTRSW